MHEMVSRVDALFGLLGSSKFRRPTRSTEFQPLFFGFMNLALSVMKPLPSNFFF